MATITREQYMANLKKAIAEMPRETEMIVISKMDDVLDLVREKQMLEQGVNADGKALGIYRGFTEKTQPWQDSRGFPKNRGQRFNLLNSGDFYKSLVLRKGRNKYKFQIKANVPYLKSILEKTNTTENTLLGLTIENTYNLDNEIIKPEIDKWLLKIL